MDILDALDRTFDHAHGVIAGVRPEQFADKTPCAEWTVRELLDHMISVVANIGSAAAGKEPSEFDLAAHPAAQFQAVAAAALDAWRAPGALDSVLDVAVRPMPGRMLAGINLLDTATHAWDLAVATGQPAALPDDVATAAMEASRATISPELRPGRFGPEVPAPDGASATDALVAFLGRTP